MFARGLTGWPVPLTRVRTWGFVAGRDSVRLVSVAGAGSTAGCWAAGDAGDGAGVAAT